MFVPIVVLLAFVFLFICLVLFVTALHFRQRQRLRQMVVRVKEDNDQRLIGKLRGKKLFVRFTDKYGKPTSFQNSFVNALADVGLEIYSSAEEKKPDDIVSVSGTYSYHPESYDRMKVHSANVLVYQFGALVDSVSVYGATIDEMPLEALMRLKEKAVKIK